MQLLSSKLKTWWQSLSDTEKQQVSTIDTPEIMSDVANVANNALLVCKLHPDCKDKDLIVWKKSKTENEAIITHTFTLNLLHKSVLGKHLDEVMSSFSIFIARQVKTSNSRSPRGTDPVPSGPKSCFNVKQEKLKDILDLISNSISSQYTDQIQQILLQNDKTLPEMYSQLVDFSSQNLFSDVSIPSFLRKLFDRFASCAFLMARKVHFAYCEAHSLDPLAPQINEKLNDFFSMMQGAGVGDNKPGLVFAKTVSQIEKEQAQEDNIDEQSTDNGNDSPKGTPLLSGDLSGIDKEEPAKKKEEAKFSVPADSKTVKAGPVAEAFAFYEGCFMGDLEMMFDPSDCLTIEEEDPLQKYQDFQTHDLYSEEEGDGDSRGSQEYEVPVQEDHGYYPANQHMMGYAPTGYAGQGHYGYYPDYYPSYMVGDQAGYYQGGGYGDYENQHSRKKSFESQSSYGSDKENFSFSQYGGGEGYDQFSYYKKKAAPFDTRSKLPPRFQRKREGNYRV